MLALQAGPVAEPQRIAALDSLRGFALLGILVMNVQAFSMPGAAYLNPTAYGDLTGVNFWVWALGRVLADQKFMTIFSLLFGAGILLMAGRAEDTGRRATALHCRRTLALIAIGAAHAYLLWAGDILYAYGMCGFVVYLLRRRRPATLLAIAFVMLTIPSLIYLMGGVSMPNWPPGKVQAMEQDFWQPTEERVARELQAYRGGWVEQMRERAPFALFFQTSLFAIWGFWRAGGLMLAGMALFRLDVLSAARSTRFYLTMAAIGFGAGLPLEAYGVHRNFAEAWSIEYAFFFGWQYNYWGSLLVSAGWIGLSMTLYRAGAASWLMRRFAAVGRMALTNYLMQTVICTTIFYGHGLGLFGSVERIGQLAIVVGVWIVQLAWSPIWLRHFRFGPAEWLWRSATYMRRQPFTRHGELRAASV